jgi:putative methyltransferase (TIGR04325 family)
VNQGKTKKIIKRILPARITALLTGFFYGWHGKYSTWEEAKKRSSGYDSDLILNKVSISAGKVRDGEAVYERDSVLFDEINYSYPVLSALLWIAAQNKGRLNVLDFGGALGSSYYQNKKFLDSIKEVNWCVVEQPDFTREGLQNFSTDRLHFFYSIEDCFKTYKVDVILLSSVLQYLSEPYTLLDQFLSKKTKFIIIDRTPFIVGDDRITIQRVHPSIYDATYPCWFFNKEKLISYLSPKYENFFEFDALDRANIKSEFKGILFRLIEKL